MSNLDYNQILSDCMGVAKTELGKKWKSVKPYAEHEFKQFAENAEFLAKLKLANEISDEELKTRLHIQRIALNTVLIAIEGVSLVAAQNVINAVTGVVFSAITTSLNVALMI